MVIEYLINPKLIEKKRLYAFVLGVMYSIMGILFAWLLFPADPSLVAVAFTSILILPAMRKLFSIEEQQDKHIKKFSVKLLWKNHNDILSVYLLLLLGVFLVYSVAAIILPSMSVNGLFRDQLELRLTDDGRGLASDVSNNKYDNSALKDSLSLDSSTNTVSSLKFSKGLFLELLTNNLLVLFACLALAFLTGDGAIFLLTWNASLWGTIFGVIARNASIVSHINPFLLLCLVLLIVLPHAFLEMLSYVLGAISGGLMSNDVELEENELDSERFKGSYWKSVLFILILAIVVVIIGGLVETFVLNNVTLYARLIAQSYLA